MKYDSNIQYIITIIIYQAKWYFIIQIPYNNSRIFSDTNNIWLPLNILQNKYIISMYLLENIFLISITSTPYLNLQIFFIFFIMYQLTYTISILIKTYWLNLLRYTTRATSICHRLKCLLISPNSHLLCIFISST